MLYWSAFRCLNYMNINIMKTKEMLLGSIKKNQLLLLQLNGQRVSSYKLLGRHVTDTFKWNEHVSSLCSKVARRLHFLISSNVLQCHQKN